MLIFSIFVAHADGVKSENVLIL